MATNKVGFNFYSIDTDRYQDRRIKRLKKDFGCTGIAVYDFILCEIYRVDGCFLVWDENTAFDVSEYFGIKETTVNEVVRYCGVVGLFDKELLSRGIITSLAIQRRYLDMCRRAKRLNYQIPNHVRVAEIAPIIPEESVIIPESITQLQEESPHSIVKNSKEKDTPSNPPPEEGRFLNLKQTEMNQATHNLQALIRRLEKLKVNPEEINKICSLSDNGLIGHPVWKILIKTENSPKIHSPGRFIISQLSDRKDEKK